MRSRSKSVLRTHLHVLSNYADILPDILGDHGTVYSRLGYGRIHQSFFFLHCNSRSHGFPLFPAKISYFHVPRAYTCFILSLVPNLETRLGLHRPGWHARRQRVIQCSTVQCSGFGEFTTHRLGSNEAAKSRAYSDVSAIENPCLYPRQLAPRWAPLHPAAISCSRATCTRRRH